MADIELLNGWSDSAIRLKLAELGHPVGPITSTTRKTIIKKLGKLMTDKKNSSVGAYSSAEESDSGHRGPPVRRQTMPPPISSRRLVSPRQSIASTTFTDYSDKKNGSASDVLSSGLSRRSSRISRGKFDYSIDSSSDMSDTELRRGDMSASSRLSRNSSATSLNSRQTHRPRWASSILNTSTPKESRSYSPNLTRRTSRLRNDANSIKESDVDEGPSFSSLLFPQHTSSYRSQESPLFRPLYPRAAPPERVSLPSRLYQAAPYILLAAFGLFLLFIGFLYCRNVYIRSSTALTQENVYPTCDDRGASDRTSCIPADDLAFAVSLYREVHPLLKSRAVKSLCDPKTTDGSLLSPYMTQRELVHYLINARPKDILRVEAGVKNLALLLISNPHWDISVLRAEDAKPPQACNQNYVNKAVPSDISLELPLLFLVPCPDLSYFCRVKLFFYATAYYFMTCTVVGVLLYGVFKAGRHYWQLAKEQEDEMLALVDRILLYVIDNTGPHNEYLAIRHVHDVLIPPKDRAGMAAIWEKAVKFIEKNESRVRPEVQKIHDDEMAVWRLVAPPTTPPPSTVSTTPAQADSQDNHLYPDLSVERRRDGQRVWQGEAFETSKGSINSLPVSPSQCLKIRHMFQSSNFYGNDWVTGVRDAIIEKCEGVRILHIKVDAQSKEGCVYVKCSSPTDAGEAFRRLHGSWFDGALVTVKYLRLERYHERFPESAQATNPLVPSNNLRLSLGGLS